MTPTKDPRTKQVAQISDPVTDQEPLRLGTGACTKCSCSAFSPGTPRYHCIGRNAQGGTCNHRDSEHR
jgi:hypothetical protein